MEKMDFLDPNNDCGQSLLKLASAGSSILAELLRLSNHIPDVFLFSSKSKSIIDLEESVKEVTKEKSSSKKAKDKTASLATEHAQKLLEVQLREDTMRL
jgi:hypothetical protein